MAKYLASAVALLLAAGVSARPADAYWGPGWGWHWHAPVVVVPPAYPVPYPAYVVRPPPRPAYWVPAHYTRYGAWVPGHWQ